jgi:hypothetical protein
MKFSEMMDRASKLEVEGYALAKKLDEESISDATLEELVKFLPKVCGFLAGRGAFLVSKPLRLDYTSYIQYLDNRKNDGRRE